MTRLTRRSARVAPLLAILVAATLVAGACGSSGPTPSPAAASPRPSPATAAATRPSPPAELTPVPGGVSASPLEPAGTPTQTNTAWGRIWDALPDSFARPNTASPADSIAGPVSAAFSVRGTPGEVAAAMKSALDAAGYSTDRSGPLEDGSFVLDSMGSWAGCRVQTTLAPLSGTTLMTILFGADCPFE